MDFLMAVHRALDYFFCDRCPTEATEGRISDLVSSLCPINYLWKFLPKEPFDKYHPVRWPRSALIRITGIDVGKQTLGPEKYGES